MQRAMECAMLGLNIRDKIENDEIRCRTKVVELKYFTGVHKKYGLTILTSRYEADGIMGAEQVRVEKIEEGRSGPPRAEEDRDFWP